MRNETVEQVVRVLPDRLGNNKGRLPVDLCKHIHALALAGDEAVLEIGVIFVGPLKITTEAFDYASEFLLHLILFRPAVLIGSNTEIAIGNE